MTSIEAATRLGIQRCCIAAMDAMEQYQANSVEDLADFEADFRGLSDVHQRLAPTFLPRLSRCRQLVAANATVLAEVVAFNKSAASVVEAAQRKRRKDGEEEEEEEEGESQHHCCGGHRKGEKASSTHRTMVENMFIQFYREWSTEGQVERSECYAPAIALAVKYSPAPRSAMVPGAGFCRLAYDLAAAGYTVEAVECSHAMALPAQWVLGALPAQRSRVLYPFVHTTANIPSSSEMQFAAASIPDVAIDPAAAARVTIVGADFVGLARSRPRTGSTDVLVTCFFIDTAYNVLDYIEAAARLLRPGGLWVNIGPLHWVHSDRESLRLTLEEIEAAMEVVGFEFLERSTLPYRHYGSPIGTLMPMVFNCRLWAARLVH